MPGTIPARGNVLASFLIAPTITPASTAATTVAEQNFTVQGLLSTDVIVGWCVNFAFTNNLVVNNCRISAANTLTISIANTTAGVLTFPSGQWVFLVSRPEATPIPSNAG